jgi:pyridoxine 5-phosphate synthase
MISLGVNIDHVATLRQARYRDSLDSPNAEPDPVASALAAEAAGAQGITAHLRADRRHIQEADLWRLRGAISTKLNLEMGNTPEILAIALKLRPADVCLVPEEREEITTEGGLDCQRHEQALATTVQQLQAAGIRVSLFIDPESTQLEAAARLGAEFVELHTGAYANAQGSDLAAELARLHHAAKTGLALGLRINAGHGLNYTNVRPILDLPGLEELNIGHSIVSRSISVGFSSAVREMVDLLSAQAR